MMSELTATQRRDLMEIVDDRHDRGSIILATQIPLSSWHGAIGDATYADAILDCIVHAALYVAFGRPGHHIQPVAGERVACIPPLALKPVW